MENELFLVIGVILCGLAFPSIVGAFSENRPPRTAAILLMLGGGMIAFAVSQSANGYAVQDFPQIFMKVINHYLR
jgi:hypothetical protein